MTLIATPTNQTRPLAAISSTLRGEVRHPNLRYRLELRANPTGFQGRLGGRLFGEEVRFEVNDTQLLGTVIGSAARLAVFATLQADHLELRVTGSNTATAHLTLTDDTANGAMRVLGTETQIRLETGDQHLSGTTANLERIQLEVNGASRFVSLSAALVALIVTRIVEHTQLESLRGMDTL
jgi:hypothetical protein